MPEIERLEEDDGGDALSELARQRRELAEREAARPRPSFIQNVEQTEVLYYFLPAAIPLSRLDVLEVSEALSHQYKVNIKGPDFSPLLATIPREQLAGMSDPELFAKLVTSDGARLTWTNGRFPLRDDFVAIRSITLNFESLLVSVSGVSEVAEVIAKEVMETIWQIAGAKKKFADIEHLLVLVGYATATRLELGYGPECLLNPELLRFLDSNLATGKRYAASMGRVKIGRSTENLEIAAMAALDDLTLRVNRFDPITGYVEDSELVFSVTAQSDYRTGRLRVTSNLPYEKHVEFLRELFEAVGNQK